MVIDKKEYVLFGPNPFGVQQTFGTNEFLWVGHALTPSTSLFNFHLGMPLAERAFWRMDWLPNGGPGSVCTRLVHFDDGPLNITEICRIDGREGDNNPWNSGMDFTAAYNALVIGRIRKNIGYQLYGALGNIKPTTIYLARLEIDERIGF